VIKQIEFATRRSNVSPTEFAEVWRTVASAGAEAPPEIRPRRITLCTTLPEEGVAQRHDGVILRWFDDRHHLEAFEQWSIAAAAEAGQQGAVIDLASSAVVVAEEVVQRGADWLEERFREGGEKLKHMAIARRAANLSPAEFSAMWRGRAGTVRRAGDSKTTAIPEEARGLAYVQNHPLPREDGEWPYDAVNEVYFDDLESLQRRVAWFAANLGGTAEEDLIGENWFLSVREEVVPVEGPSLL
jgi:hypothetical protein